MKNLNLIELKNITGGALTQVSFDLDDDGKCDGNMIKGRAEAYERVFGLTISDNLCLQAEFIGTEAELMTAVRE